MIIEKIIFNLAAFTLFTIVFMKMIKKNDTSYVYILALEFIGIVINFIELIFNLKLNFRLKKHFYYLIYFQNVQQLFTNNYANKNNNIVLFPVLFTKFFFSKLIISRFKFQNIYIFSSKWLLLEQNFS